MRAKPKKFGPRLTISLTPKNHAQLEQVAAANDASVSWVIRRAIDNYLSRTQQQRRTRKPREEGSTNVT
jgi:predicted transcriptional regulator